MKGFKSSIRDSWEKTMPLAAPFPFEKEFPLPEKSPSELVLRCAGAALIFGMLGIMVSVWGNPLYSPAVQALDIQEIQETLSPMGEYLLQNLTEVFI